MLAYDDEENTLDDYIKFVMYTMASRSTDFKKQKTQNCILKLTQTSPEIFKDYWEYDPIPRISGCHLALLWLAANKVIGSCGP